MLQCLKGGIHHKTMSHKNSVSLFFIVFIFSFQFAKAQNTKDSLHAVNFFGTIYPVKNSVALQLYELKPMVRNNEVAFKSFKKAKQIKVISTSLQILSIIPAAYAIVAEKESDFWIGIGLSGMINGIGTYLMLDPYNKHITNCIKAYNKSKSVQ